MADITLAESNGNVWVINGDAFVDDLLANTLAENVVIEIVTCADHREMMMLWQGYVGEEVASRGMPCVIHPRIARRVKNKLAPQSLRFAPWSAMIDDAAGDAVAGAAGWLARNPAARLVLRQYAVDGAPDAAADLQRLRAQLVMGALERAGVAVGRLTLETAVADAADAGDRLDLVTA